MLTLERMDRELKFRPSCRCVPRSTVPDGPPRNSDLTSEERTSALAGDCKLHNAAATSPFTIPRAFLSSSWVDLRLTPFCFPLTFPSGDDRVLVLAVRKAIGASQGKEDNVGMKSQADHTWKKSLVVLAIMLLAAGQVLVAQNLGNSPQFNVAVQGQTGAQPEGTFLNFINWIGNVIAPVGAGGAVVGAVVSWLTGRGFGRWLLAAASLLAVSGVTRLIEFWITNGTGGVT